MKDVYVRSKTLNTLDIGFRSEMYDQTEFLISFEG